MRSGSLVGDGAVWRPLAGMPRGYQCAVTSQIGRVSSCQPHPAGESMREVMSTWCKLQRGAPAAMLGGGAERPAFAALEVATCGLIACCLLHRTLELSMSLRAGLGPSGPAHLAFNQDCRQVTCSALLPAPPTASAQTGMHVGSGFAALRTHRQRKGFRRRRCHEEGRTCIDSFGPPFAAAAPSPTSAASGYGTSPPTPASWTCRWAPSGASKAGPASSEPRFL